MKTDLEKEIDWLIQYAENTIKEDVEHSGEMRVARAIVGMKAYYELMLSIASGSFSRR